MNRYKTYPLEFLKVSEAIYGVPLSSPKAVMEYMRSEAMADREIFWVLHVNAKNRIVRKEMAAMGAIDHCVIMPCIVLRGAVASGVPSILTVHNHPSGDPAPSEDDRKLWKRIREGCDLLGIRLLDNIILGKGNYFSEEERK